MYAMAEYTRKHYPVSVARERLADILDQAEGGSPVFIERRGVRYRLSVEPPPRRRKAAPPRIEIVDPAVEQGDWTWDWTPDGLTFRGRR